MLTKNSDDRFPKEIPVRKDPEKPSPIKDPTPAPEKPSTIIDPPPHQEHPDDIDNIGH